MPMRKYVIDCHCHTISSGHAYSTLYEYAKEAYEKGMELIAITDHAPMMPGSCHKFHFDNLRVLPEIIHGIRVLKGVEVNIMDEDGTLDLTDSDLKRLDIVIASIHSPCFNVGDIDRNTNAILKAIQNMHVDIIGHPDDSRVPLDYVKVIKAAKENYKIIEMNNSSMSPKAFRQNSKDNYRILLKLCMEYNVPIILASDSHYHSYVGEFEYAEEIINEMSFPEDLILNTSVDKLMKYLTSRDGT